MKIEKSKKLIADFMDLDTWILQGELCVKNDNGSPYPLVEYNSSWDSLMPVVEKIEMMWVKYSCVRYENVTRPATFFCRFMTYAQERWDRNNNFINGEVKKTRFDATYNAVVKFIEWYNKNKTQ